MAIFKIKIKNQIDINQKTKIYFTCHPDDFEECFEKICEDIFKTHDYVIHYTEDMNEAIADNEKSCKLGKCSLVVVPVTFKLLTTPNRAMNEDIPYAIKEHIPLLPIVMESGIDELYSKSDKFSNIEYLNPNSRDITGVSYYEQLKKRLRDILTNNETAEKKYLTGLELIGKSEIAGSYEKGVQLITDAAESGYGLAMDRLYHMYYIGFYATQDYNKSLVWAKKYADHLVATLGAEHPNTLIALFNLAKNYGVIGEHEKAISIFEKIYIPFSNEFGKEHSFTIAILNIFADACKKTGKYEKAVLLYEDLRTILLDMFGEDFIETIPILNKIAEIYHLSGDNEKILEFDKKRHDIFSKAFGEKAPETIKMLNELANSYLNNGNKEEALENFKKSYDISREVLGEEHTDTVGVLNAVAYTSFQAGYKKEALEYYKTLQPLSSRVFGADHKITLSAERAIAVISEMLTEE